MAEELIDVLMKFHREVVLPDVERLIVAVDLKFDAKLTSFRNETMSHFDAIYKRFDRLEDEYQGAQRIRETAGGTSVKAPPSLRTPR